MNVVLPAAPQPGKPGVAQPHDHARLAEGTEVSEDTTVAAPHEVDVPLPPTPQEQISVPASINGRDLSQGRP